MGPGFQTQLQKFHSYGKCEDPSQLNFTYVYSSCICCGLNLFLVQNFWNRFSFHVLLSCIHYHNLEQWQMKLKSVQENSKPRMNLNHNIYNHFILNIMLETYEKLWYFLFFLDKYNNQQKVGLLLQLLFLTFFKYLRSGVITELVYETSVTICFQKNNVLLILWLFFSHTASYSPFGTIMPSGHIF